MADEKDESKKAAEVKLKQFQYPGSTLENDHNSGVIAQYTWATPDVLEKVEDWYRKSFGRNTPWGSANSAALVTAVETALERELAGLIMRGGDKPAVRKLKAGALLTEQGKPGDEVFLVLDGVLALEVDGEPLAEFGPGAILEERAVIESGLRTSTLRAVTKCRVAAARGDQLDRAVLEQISQGHRRENSG